MSIVGNQSADKLITAADIDPGFVLPSANLATTLSGKTLSSSGDITSLTKITIGETSSTWGGSTKILQLASGSLVSYSTTYLELSLNQYWDGANYKFINNGYASNYYQTGGGHYWQISSASGTAGNNVTQTSVMALTSSSLAITGAITATGNITAYFSDDRLKTKLGKIDSALDKLCSLEGFFYEANETAQALGYEVVREVGVSAQSVQAVLPEVVAPAPIDAQYLTVRYDRMIPLLIEAIKELREEVRAMK